MFCPDCGTQLPETAKFCPSCGNRVTVISPQASAVTPPPVQEPTYTPPVQEPGYTPPVQEPSSYTLPIQEPGYTPPVQDMGAFSQTSDTVNRSMPQKKKRSGCLTFILVLAGIALALIVGVIALLAWVFEDEVKEYNEPITYSTSDDTTPIITNLSNKDLREQYTTIYGDGSDQVTLLVYLLGSDLESDGGYASTDLEEMLDADFDDNLNLIVMTGGATDWSNRNISGSTCQYWQVKDGSLISIDDNLGRLDMTAQDTLTSFVSDMTAQFPANRYGLILWDHGGGTFCGFGYDEHYPDGEMSLDEISRALAATGVKFDFVGFDACLMGTLEAAVMLEPYADYMIASEELEESTGWYYTTFLEAWSDDAGMETVDMATILINSFVEASLEEYRRAEATLSVVDLCEVPALYQMLEDYFDDVDLSSDQTAYTNLASALSHAKSFGEGDYEQFDMVDFITYLDLEGTEELVGAVNSVVKYHANSSIDNANGLSMYFPYVYPEYYSETCAVMEAIGMDDDYTNFMSQYVSASSGDYSQYTSSGGGGGFSGGGSGGAPSGGGQSGGSSGGQSGGQSGGGYDRWDDGGGFDFSTESWFDQELSTSYADLYDGSDYEDLEIVLKGDDYVLQLSDKQWENIITIELQVLLDDGAGYIDLGSDNVYEFDRDGDLLIAFDYTWVTLDGHTVPFYCMEEVYRNDRDWYTYGIVPAMLNGDTYVEVLVYWDDTEPYGYVTGYRKYSATGEPMGKGTFALQSGDTLDWVFDYYTYDGDYDGTCSWGSTYTYRGGDIEVSYDDVGNMDALVYFQLTDIYNHVYTSESVWYTD